ncbi:MAG: phosphoglucosamine mutase [Candidatus Sumerlaeaceae bacterium]
MSSQPMISVAGIRGIVGDSLTPESFIRYVLAFGTLIEGGPVVVGSDTRLTRDMMRHLAFAALESCGCKIYDIGLVPTPTVGLMVRELGASGGIAITASHNPAEWNAYKFFDEQGSFLTKEQNLRLIEIVSSGAFRRATYRTVGKVNRVTTAIERHIEKVLTEVDVKAIRTRRFRVVADCVNGVGAMILPPLLDKLGCTSKLLFDDINREFAHNPEPLPENLAELCEQVRKSGADLGIAVDPDADRLALVDETGRPLGEERTVTLAAASILERKKGPVVVNLSTTRAMDDVTKAAGVPLYRTPIGEANVVAKIRATNAVFGGEGNGGVIYPAVHCGRDAATGIALILDTLARKGVALSQLNSQIPDYKIVKTKFARGDRNVAEILARMREEFRDALELVSEDGLKAVFADSWVHLRPSGTEPVVRVFAEAPTQAAAQQLVDRVWQRVINIG